MTDKYTPLQKHLKAQSGAQISMSFADIERLIGAKLPPSARKHRPWWSNHPGNSVITRAWLNAGYKSEQVDMKRECLVFCRASNDLATNRDSVRDSAVANGAYVVSFYGCMKGMITVSDDCDLTAPADPNWHVETI